MSESGLKMPWAFRQRLLIAGEIKEDYLEEVMVDINWKICLEKCFRKKEGSIDGVAQI